MTTFFRYVPHANVQAYEAQGWRVVSDLTGCRHGAFAVLMQWEGAGEPN
jgi:hypothetical protein